MKTIDTLKTEAYEHAVLMNSHGSTKGVINAYLSYLAEHKAEIVEVMAAHYSYANRTYLEDGIRDALTASKLLEPVV